jgi:hypothetical protein
VKRIACLLTRKFILVLVAVVLVAGVAACGESTPTTHELTHSSADAEYILSWDAIVSRCPDMNDYDITEYFVRRGETVQVTAQETATLEEDSPAAWSSLRGVTMGPEGNRFRSFGVWIMFFDTAEYLDEFIEFMKMQGLSFQEDGDFVTAVLESGPPTQSVQLHLAGNQFYILLLGTASSDESLFCGKDTLEELIAIAKSNITSLEITPLPAEIPDRIVTEDATHQWQELMTVRSDELAPPVRVPEEDFYNDLWFEERPLMQVFNFTIDKDWRFVMTATGEVDTKFEVYTTVSLPGEQGSSYAYDQVFSLYSETVTITREQPLEEGYEPPVNVEIKVLFDLPISWVITIEN